MKEQDKVSLLFEMIFETDLSAVYPKIYEIKVSKEYNRLAEAVVALSDTEAMKDVVERFDKLDVDGILTFDRALEVQKEIKELDAQVNFMKNFNPYLSNSDNVHKYGVNTVGDINIEVSCKNQKVDDFTTKEGITPLHRRKVMAIKAIKWYKEAKKQIYMLIENSKIFLSRIRYSKVRYNSLGFQLFIMIVFALLSACGVFFFPQFSAYRDGSMPSIYQGITTMGLYVMGATIALYSIIRAHYYYYGYRAASKMRYYVEKQEHIVSQLDETSIKFERDLMNRIKKPHKVNTNIAQLGLLADDNNFGFNQIFDFMYNEKEFYFTKYKFLLVIANILFVLSLVASFTVGLMPLIMQLVK